MLLRQPLGGRRMERKLQNLRYCSMILTLSYPFCVRLFSVGFSLLYWLTVTTTELTARVLGMLSLILPKAHLLEMTRKLAQRQIGTTSEGNPVSALHHSDN
jgi:hypothetical protein